jgi:hypothetical protein
MKGVWLKVDSPTGRSFIGFLKYRYFPCCNPLFQSGPREKDARTLEKPLY